MCVCLFMCVCLSLRLSVCLSDCEHIFRITYPIFTTLLCVLPVAMDQSISVSVVICYVFQVLRMTSCLYLANNDQ